LLSAPGAGEHHARFAEPLCAQNSRDRFIASEVIKPEGLEHGHLKARRSLMVFDPRSTPPVPASATAHYPKAPDLGRVGIALTASRRGSPGHPPHAVLPTAAFELVQVRPVRCPALDRRAEDRWEAKTSGKAQP